MRRRSFWWGDYDTLGEKDAGTRGFQAGLVVGFLLACLVIGIIYATHS